MSNNLPYLMLYKGDFLRGNVSACSIAAQGLWLRIMILMHDSERPGYLCLNGSPIPSRLAAVKCAVTVDEYETLLAELMSVCAFSTSREGIIFAPELVAEHEERAKNAERQRRFKEKKKGNASVTAEVTEKKRDGNALRAHSSISSSNSFPDGKGKPPDNPPKETQEQYLERKQKEYPQHDVPSVFQKFLVYCKTNHIKASRPYFDSWLDNEYEPLTGNIETKSELPDLSEVKKKRDEQRKQFQAATPVV